MNQKRKLSTLSLGVALLLAPALTSGCLSLSDGNQLAVPPFRLDSQAIYRNQAGDEFSVRIEEEIYTRGPRGQEGAAIQVSIGENFTAAISPKTGLPIWWQDHPYQATPDASGSASDSPGTRYFEPVGPWLFGASVLAGRTLEPGTQLLAPVSGAEETRWANFTVMEPEGEGWPVQIDTPGTILPFGAEKGRIFLETSTPFPVQIDIQIPDRQGGIQNRTFDRVSFQEDGGSAWGLAKSDAWDKTSSTPFPLISYDGIGPPPQTEKRYPFGPFPLDQAIKEARANATGLDEFMSDSNGTVFYSAQVLPSSSFSAAPMVGPTTIPVSATESRGWLLIWQEQGSHDAWKVQIQQDREYTAGEQAQNRTYVADEEAHRVPSNTTGAVLGPRQVALDAFARETPSKLGNFSRYHVEPTRVWNPPRWAYELGYISEGDEDQSGANAQRIQTITVDGTNGEIEKIRGAPSFIHQFDYQGWNQNSTMST